MDSDDSEDGNDDYIFEQIEKYAGKLKEAENENDRNKCRRFREKLEVLQRKLPAQNITTVKTESLNSVTAINMSHRPKNERFICDEGNLNDVNTKILDVLTRNISLWPGQAGLDYDIDDHKRKKIRLDDIDDECVSLAAEFHKFKNLPYQTIETLLSTLLVIFKHDLIRDLNIEQLVSYSNIEEMIDIKLRKEFDDNHLLNYIVTDKLKSITKNMNEIQNHNKIEFKYFKEALDNIQLQISALPKVMSNSLRELSQPMGDLILYFDRHQPNSAIRVKTSFKIIHSFLQSDPDTNRVIEPILRLLNQLHTRWLRFIDQRESYLQSSIFHVEELMKNVRTVDLEALITLLKTNKDQSECLNGADAIFLIGCTGVGKSTITQYLGGSEFQRIQQDGAARDHYFPIPASPELRKFVTSPFGKSETSCVQCFRLEQGHKSAWVVDTPGLGDTEGVAKQIANVVGIVGALKRCGRVKMVFCVSDYDMANRLKEQRFVDLCTSVVELFGDIKNSRELSYIVTKLPNPEAGLQHLARAFRKEAMQLEQQHLCKTLWLDFADKIEDQHGVHTMKINDLSSRQELLNDLLNFDVRVVRNPEEAFEEFIPSECKDALTIQFSKQIENISTALKTNSIALIEYKIEQLYQLTTLLNSRGCVDAYGKAIKGIFESLSASFTIISNNSKELFCSGTVWTAEILQELQGNIVKICKFSDFYYAQVSRLILLLHSNDIGWEQQLEDRNFLQDICAIFNLNLSNGYDKILPSAVDTYDLAQVQVFVDNLVTMDTMLLGLDEDLKMTFGLVINTVQQYRHRTTSLLENNFMNHSNRCKELTNELMLLDCLPHLSYLREFTSLLERFLPPLKSTAFTPPPPPPPPPPPIKGKRKFTASPSREGEVRKEVSYAEEVNRAQGYIYQFISEYLDDRLRKKDIYEMREQLHKLLSSLQEVKESKQLASTGLNRNKLSDYQHQLLSLLSNEMKSVTAEVTHRIKNNKKSLEDVHIFSVFKAHLERLDGLGCHRLLSDGCLTLRKVIQQHIQEFTRSLKRQVNEQMDLFWDDVADITIACKYEALKVWLAQLYRSHQCLDTDHFNEISQSSINYINRFLEKREQTLGQFHECGLDAVESQLRWKFRADRVLWLLEEEGVYHIQQGPIHEHVSALLSRCQEVKLTIQQNISEVTVFIRNFYTELFTTFMKFDSIVSCVKHLGDQFDFGQGNNKVLSSLMKNSKYLSSPGQDEIHVLNDWYNIELEKHYDAMDSMLKRSYSWFITVEPHQILTLQLTDGLFDDLGAGVGYLTHLKRHNPDTPTPLDHWSQHLERFYGYAAKVAEQASINQLTQFSAMCMKLGVAVDNYMPPNLHFSALTRTLKGSVKGTIKSTKLAIINRDYEIVAQGLENLDKDDADMEDINYNPAELTLRSQLKNELNAHILNTTTKLCNLDLDTGALSMRTLWRDLVQLNRAEIFLGSSFGVLEILPNYNRLLETVEELSSKIATKTKLLKSMLSKGLVAEALSTRSNLEAMLKSHNCLQLLGDIACEYVEGCCNRCKPDKLLLKDEPLLKDKPSPKNKPLLKDADATVSCVVKDKRIGCINTNLGTKLVDVLNGLSLGIAVIDTRAEKLISQYKKNAKSLSTSARSEEFAERLPPQNLLQDFLENDDDSDNDDLRVVITELLNIVSEQVEDMLKQSEKISEFLDERSLPVDNIPSRDLYTIQSVITILYESRHSLPRFGDIDLCLQFKGRIEACYGQVRDLVDGVEIKQTIQMSDSRNLDTLVEQYLSSPHRNKLKENITLMSQRFQRELDADLPTALAAIHYQLPLWKKMNFAGNFSNDVSAVMNNLVRELTLFQQYTNKEEFLEQFSRCEVVIRWAVRVIDDQVLDTIQIRQVDLTTSVDQRIKSLLLIIVKTLREHLEGIYHSAETFFGMINGIGQVEVDMKRLPSLLKSIKLLMTHQGLYSSLSSLVVSPLFHELKAFVGDPIDMNSRFLSFCETAKTFLEELQFINPLTINVNAADRETYYQKVAVYFNVLEHADWIPDISISAIQQRVSSSIQAWVENGLASLKIDISDLNLDQLNQFNIAYSNLSLIAKLLPDFEREAKACTDQMDHGFFQLIDSWKNNCINNTAVGDILIEDMAYTLVNLQKIGNAVSCYTKRVSGTIDYIVDHHQKKAISTGGEIISRLGLALNECVDGTGQQIITEHAIFKGYEMYLRNTRFTRLSLDDMLENIEGSNVDKKSLRTHVTSLTDAYWGILKEYLGPRNRKNIPKLPDEARKLAKSGQNHSWITVLQIIAHVFAFWTLSDLQHYDSAKDNNYLLQPHMGQFIAIIRILCFDTENSNSNINNNNNCNNNNNIISNCKKALNGFFDCNWFGDKTFKLQNHLVQVRTGEGKSVILGVLAVVLALMNFEVDCVCYSKHLSERDHQDFIGLFKAFNVDENIHYGTFNDLCERALNRERNVRECVEQAIITNTTRKSPNTPTKKSNKNIVQRILLIDEVDVFFQPGFYGSVYNIFATLKAQQFPEIERLILSIWKYRNSRASEDRLLHQVKTSPEFQACCALFAHEWHVLIEEAVKDMLSTLSTFQNHQYVFDSESQQIGYLDSDNTVSFKKVKGYNTMFAYLKVHDNHSITEETLKRHLQLLILSASFSYAEFPKSYTGILGVSGTLRTLSNQEKEILATEYHLEKFTYLSSAYGREPVLWDPNAIGSISIKKENEFYVALVDEIRRRQGEATVRRPVLVFFRNRADIDMFRSHPAFANYRDTALVLYAGMKDENRLENIRRSMEKGRVTLSTREFGRGVNFYCPSKEIEAVGGVHVITTFVSVEISEEVQIMGRAGRQGCLGSFSMVLPNSQMDLIGIDEKTQQDMESAGKRYDVIHQHRLSTYEKAFPERLQFIEQIKVEHIRSQEFVSNLKNGKLKPIRDFLLSKNESKFGNISSRTVILLDATGSMSHLLNQAKLTVTTMLNRVTEILIDNSISSGFQIQFVAYRNYNSHPDKLLECSTWESSPANLVQFIDTIGPEGGWHNEAIEMGLWHVNQEATQMTITQVIIIGDAPPNTRDEVNSKRSQCNSLLANHPRYHHPVYFEDELALITQKNIPINAFYIKGTRAKNEFARMAKCTGGSCESLDVNSKTAADSLTGIVSTNILSDIGKKLGGSAAQTLVASYNAKYPFQTDGFI